VYLSQIPGYSRACKRADRLEDYWRDFAFLGIDEKLFFGCRRSLEVRQLTLRMFIELCAVRSPFIVGGPIRPEHVAQVLWRISRDYELRSSKPRGEIRKAFVASIADISYKGSVRAINRYMDRMLIDKPPHSSRGNDAKADTSFAAAMIHGLAKSYGWSPDQILDLPMPQLFQYLRNIQRSADPDICLWNPIRERLVAKVTRKFLTERKNKK